MTTPLEYRNHSPSHTHAYLSKPILDMCGPLFPGIRVLDVGCGNGALASEFLARGGSVVGVDLSGSGVEIARSMHPLGRFEQIAADDHLLSNLAELPFDIVISAEVVEHIYDPRGYARGCFKALRSGGRFICTTPYHGYLKNVAIALSGRFDQHVNPLWDGGHIKFWSHATLTELFTETGFKDFAFRGTGRVPYLWKSMIISANRP